MNHEYQGTKTIHKYINFGGSKSFYLNHSMFLIDPYVIIIQITSFKRQNFKFLFGTIDCHIGPIDCHEAPAK